MGDKKGRVSLMREFLGGEEAAREGGSRQEREKEGGKEGAGVGVGEDADAQFHQYRQQKKPKGRR